MLKFYTELFGIFFLTIGVGASPDPLSAGILMIAMVYVASDISGGHFNPAVSLSAWMAEEIETRELFSYCFAQISGGILGALFIWWISDSAYVPSPSASTSTATFAIVEFLFSFLFVLVFLFMMYPAKRRRNPVYGLVIGLAFAGCYMITEPVSGTGLNPALTSSYILADTLNNGYSYFHLPVYLFSPLLGGLAAAFVFKKIR